tara:strand:- start:66 stop:641 length:576 start_codon:yes stop_codon:yes gene_type:complete
MAEKTKVQLRAFSSNPSSPATSADLQLKLNYNQFVDVVDSALNLTDGGAVAASVKLRGYTATTPSIITKWPAHSDTTAGNITLTIAQVLTGILEADPAADIAYTLPTPALAVAGVAGVAVGDCIDFAVINTGTATADEIITVTMPSNATAVGSMKVLTAGVAVGDGSGSGLFRIRFTSVTGTIAYTVYRIA